jgi:hypothetical protein
MMHAQAAGDLAQAFSLGREEAAESSAVAEFFKSRPPISPAVRAGSL